jgi:hypothetical protein
MTTNAPAEDAHESGPYVLPDSRKKRRGMSNRFIAVYLGEL